MPSTVAAPHRIRRPAPPSQRPLPLRLLQFAVGVAFCAVAVWLTLQVALGLSPWDVLHAGLADATGMSFGTALILVGLAVLGVSAALGVRPGIGTLVNQVVVGITLDRLLATRWLDALPHAPVPARLAVLVGAVALLGLGCAMYIGSGFGAGPRDSLMLACYQRGVPIGPARCVIELSVLVVGWLLAGPVGVGTVVIALGLGPAVSAGFRLIGQEPPARAQRRTAGSEAR